MREWDSNGTNFGYNPERAAIAGEFGHNDFYPVAVAAAQLAGSMAGRRSWRCSLLDEIRGRLAEVFALKNLQDRSRRARGDRLGRRLRRGARRDASNKSNRRSGWSWRTTFRSARFAHGKQLSDSKGASAAISAEVAVLSMRRAMRGFVGPADIFRNPQAIFCLFEKPAEADTSPFDLALATGGDDFAVMGMHFKLGLYEHQSAGAIQGADRPARRAPRRCLTTRSSFVDLRITIYEPAFGIIGDPAKRDPRTRQSADHSMVYIIATLLRKAYRSTAHRLGWQRRLAMLMLAGRLRDEPICSIRSRGS